MLLLSIDTSGRNGSVALVRAEGSSLETLALLPLEGRMYSAQLIPAIDEALKQTHLSKRDIDAFVVASGPGSFTGLRVGLSTVKALSEVLHKPIAAVSVLEVAARSAQQTGHVIVALDAGRKQVFVGDYNFSSGKRAESLMALENFFAGLPASEAQLFSPDATVRLAAASHNLVMNEVAAPQADAFARIGYEKLRAGETIDAEVLEANYIRASDAELFSLPKLTQ
jgi:tRNA threonylcarbamoyladenosine biosynthesis protein TsaB